MALKNIIKEAVEAASGGVMLNLFQNLFKGLKPEDWKEIQQKIVRSGILPFAFSKEDEAKLIVRFGKIQNGLKPGEAHTVAEFLATRCNERERNSFRCSLALIEEVSRVTKVTHENKAKQKVRTVDKTETTDAGLDFLKKLAALPDHDQRRMICEGLGLFDSQNAIRDAWAKIDGVIMQASTAVEAARQKMEALFLPQTPPSPIGASRRQRLAHWLKNLF